MKDHQYFGIMTATIAAPIQPGGEWTANAIGVVIAFSMFVICLIRDK